jgi:hypothetical protein
MKPRVVFGLEGSGGFGEWRPSGSFDSAVCKRANCFAQDDEHQGSVERRIFEGLFKVATSQLVLEAREKR